jgi:hypothetical protein
MVADYGFALMDRSVFARLQPSDGAAALRSLPRRFLEQFRPDELAGEPDAAPVDEAPDGSALSPLQLVLATTRALETLGRAVRRTLLFDEPSFDGLFDRPARDGADRAPAVDINEALAQLAAAAEPFAAEVIRTPLDHWNRVVILDGERVPGIELVREAVATGRTYLEALGPTLEALRRRA